MERTIKDIMKKLETPSAVNAQFTKLLNSLSGLRVISNLGSQDLSRDELIDAMIKAILEHLDAEQASLYICNGAVLNCVASLNWEQFSKNASSINRKPQSALITENIVSETAALGKMRYVSNFTTRNRNLLHLQTGVNEVGSLICAPLILNGSLTGVIELTHPDPEHFGSWQEHSVIIYTDFMSILLNNYKLMHEMQNILDLRTEELSHSLEESEKLRARFEEMSIIDSLTKLYNRRYFYTEVPAGLSRAIRYNKAFSLLLMDLDLFKQVNDTYGHACGDKALQALSDILRRFTREGDTLARLGGEEFVLALPETNSEGALKLAERIRATVADNDWLCDGIEMNITISIGISSLGKTTENELQNIDAQLSDILREADRALYFVKQNGRNKVKSFMDIP